MAAKEIISLRVWRSDLERWKQAAKDEGLDRSSWMNMVLNNATNPSPQGGDASVVVESAWSNDVANPTPQ